MKAENKTEVWQFLEENMTNYSQDKRIYRIDRLECMMEDMFSDEEVDQLGFKGYTDAMAHFEINELTDECFAEAMENFTRKPDEKFELKVVFGKELVTEYHFKGDSAKHSSLNNGIDGEIKTYEFNSELEKSAFADGLNNMDGWNGYLIMD